IYQRVCQLATGNGGWPLSVFLTPDQKPYYVGTYFPADGRYGIPSFASVLNQMSQSYQTSKQQVDSAASEFMQSLSSMAMDIEEQGQHLDIDRSVLDEAGVGLLQMADPAYGGFGNAPKFPNISNLLFMLRYYDISRIGRFRDFVMFTANKMAAGGIHDQLGGGFSRYSTDRKWLVPHFEKMLYDNALLTQLYAELYQISGVESYLQIVESTLEFVIREMTSPEGGFYSAQDADSDGEEGKFYVWSKGEIVESLGDSTISDIFCDYYGVTEGGNFEGKNILSIVTSLNSLSQKYGLDPNSIEKIIKNAREKLFEIRDRRTRPGTDDKILTSWNGLMISGFAKGYRITNNKKYLDYALKAINFIETKIAADDEARLRRTFKNGISRLNAYLDDYAFYINGLLDVFEVDCKAEYLEKALNYTDFMLKHFWDSSSGNLFLTSDDHEQLIIRTKNFYHLAIPSGNSMAAYNLLRLFHIVQNKDYLKKAEQIIKSASTPAVKNPFGFGQLLVTMSMYFKKSPLEIVIIQRATKEPAYKMTSWLNKQYLADGISVVIRDMTQLEKLQKYPLFAARTASLEKEDRAEVAFVCKNFACSLPVYSVEELQRTIAPQ
ncbi:MAG TPA: thioredoxin domain-containing protein, partial [Nitrososphaeraceae archaeon]|nr:thioredoxin domain-containing protein [Nitrososphaeraceae archaeon]